jgi:hypothetical protein
MSLTAVAANMVAPPELLINAHWLTEAEQEVTCEVCTATAPAPCSSIIDGVGVLKFDRDGGLDMVLRAIGSIGRAKSRPVP